MGLSRSAPAILAALATLGTCCSSGVGSHAAPTASTTAGARPLVAAELGSCPTTSTEGAPNNAGVEGLDQKVVPIDAAKVLLCEYEGIVGSDPHVPLKLEASGRLESREAAIFERDTNRLPMGLRGAPSCTGPGGGFQNVVMTFATETQRVEVQQEYGACSSGQLWNGKFLAVPTSSWLRELLRSIGSVPKP